jgi:hypothetical protein
MAARRFKRVRTAGQDSVPLNTWLATALCFGVDMFGGQPSGLCTREFDGGDDDFGELDLALAEDAWNRYRDQVLDHWAAYWPKALPECLPTTWAARVFDDEPQVKKPRGTRGGCSEVDWARDRIDNIEEAVALARHRLA